MKCITGLVLSMLLFHEGTLAQGNNYATGARSRGISGTSTTLSDAYASMNNIGALAPHNKSGCYFTSSLLYGIPGLLKIGAGYNGRLLKGLATINFFRLGDRWFSEYKLGLGYSHRIRYISLGIQLNCIQYRMQDYGTLRFIGIEMGGLVKISSALLFGAYIINPIFFRDDHDPGSLSGALLKAGISYRPSGHLMFNLESHYEVEGYHYLLAGLEYILRDKFILRTGFNLEILTSSFGFGFRTERLTMDYAADLHPSLGLSHEVSLTLQIGGER